MISNKLQNDDRKVTGVGISNGYHAFFFVTSLTFYSYIINGLIN